MAVGGGRGAGRSDRGQRGGQTAAEQGTGAGDGGQVEKFAADEGGGHGVGFDPVSTGWRTPNVAAGREGAKRPICHTGDEARWSGPGGAAC